MHSDDQTPAIRLVRAANPGPLTGTGTNTWIVGTGSVAVIDPGPDDPAHLEAILAALAGAEVAAILVTHAHRDHSALAPALARRVGAPVLAFGDAEAGRSAGMARLMAAGFAGGGEGVDTAFSPDRTLTDGEAVALDGATLTALHMPGHMGGHLCFALGDVLFSGDHVMGWASTVISPPDGDMGAYMASLRRLSETGWRRLLPGHGTPVEDPATRIADLIAHRMGREAEILAELARGPATAAALTARLYAKIPAALHPAAHRNVLAHLIDLMDRNRITTDAFPDLSQPFRLF